MIKFRDRLAYPFVHIKKGQASLTLTNKIKKRKICALSVIKKHSPILVSVFVWSGLRDSLGSLLRSPTRTRPTNSPPDCSLLRNGLFESRLLQFKNKKSPPCGEDFHFWSGLRDSNSLPSPWQGDALPDELNPQLQDLL